MKRKFKTDILVRNNRLEMMQKQGINVNYKILSDEEYLQELKNKIVEEANEVCDCKNCNELAEEIADILEVVEHLLDVSNLKMEDIEKIKKIKQEKVGKFDRKIKTFFVEVDDENDVIDYYLKRPNKYPEIK